MTLSGLPGKSRKFFGWAVATVILLAGCSPSPTEVPGQDVSVAEAAPDDSPATEARPLNPSATIADGIAFQGPWAAEFADLYSHFDSDFAHRVLADSVITDQELQEALVIVKDCYQAKGYRVDYNKYGYPVASPMQGNGDDGLDVMGQCEYADGGVHSLYYQMLVNPDHGDDMTIRAECLVRHGLVDPGFTGQDLEQLYHSDTPFTSWPWDTSDPVAQACMLDPEGIVGG